LESSIEPSAAGLVVDCAFVLQRVEAPSLDSGRST